MAEAVCEHLDVFLYDVENGMRHDAASRARSVICYLAVSRWKYPRGRVAELVGVSASAVSHALARGEQILRDDPSLRETIQEFTSVPASEARRLAQG
jgi:chromosomal replication initiation ATPase DnaA